MANKDTTEDKKAKAAAAGEKKAAAAAAQVKASEAEADAAEKESAEKAKAEDVEAQAKAAAEAKAKETAKPKRKEVTAAAVRKVAARLDESGTGKSKTAILEALAQKIDDNDNPFPDAADANAACICALRSNDPAAYPGTVLKIQNGGA